MASQRPGPGAAGVAAVGFAGVLLGDPTDVPRHAARVPGGSTPTTPSAAPARPGPARPGPARPGTRVSGGG
ncbi:hypothetical protein [Streptomyces sp. NPDC002587]